MKRAVLVILAALAWAGVAEAVTDVQNGQSTRGVQQLRLVGGILTADSTGKVFTFTSTGGAITREEAPLNSVYSYTTDVYYDTMSVNGRSIDSTGVATVIQYQTLALGLKMEGHHGAVSKEVRIGVTPIWQMTSTAGDTTVSFAWSGIANAVAGKDSTGVTADPAANVGLFAGAEVQVTFMNFTAVSINSLLARSAILSFKNPGMPYVRFLFRVISDEGTAATQGGRFKLRASLGARAL